jgi:hypothetical protein
MIIKEIEKLLLEFSNGRAIHPVSAIGLALKRRVNPVQALRPKINKIISTKPAKVVNSVTRHTRYT